MDTPPTYPPGTPPGSPHRLSPTATTILSSPFSSPPREGVRTEVEPLGLHLESGSVSTSSDPETLKRIRVSTEISIHRDDGDFEDTFYDADSPIFRREDEGTELDRGSEGSEERRTIGEWGDGDENADRPDEDENENTLSPGSSIRCYSTTHHDDQSIPIILDISPHSHVPISPPSSSDAPHDATATPQDESEQHIVVPVDPATAARVHEAVRRKGLEGHLDPDAPHPVPKVLVAQITGEFEEPNMERRRSSFRARGDRMGSSPERQPGRMSNLNPHSLGRGVAPGYEVTPHSRYVDSSTQTVPESPFQFSDTESSGGEEAIIQSYTNNLHSRGGITENTSIPLVLRDAAIFSETDSPSSDADLLHDYKAVLELTQDLESIQPPGSASQPNETLTLALAILYRQLHTQRAGESGDGDGKPVAEVQGIPDTRISASEDLTAANLQISDLRTEIASWKALYEDSAAKLRELRIVSERQVETVSREIHVHLQEIETMKRYLQRKEFEIDRRVEEESERVEALREENAELKERVEVFERMRDEVPPNLRPEKIRKERRRPTVESTKEEQSSSAEAGDTNDIQQLRNTIRHLESQKQNLENILSEMLGINFVRKGRLSVSNPFASDPEASPTTMDDHGFDLLPLLPRWAHHMHHHHTYHSLPDKPVPRYLQPPATEHRAHQLALLTTQLDTQMRQLIDSDIMKALIRADRLREVLVWERPKDAHAKDYVRMTWEKRWDVDESWRENLWPEQLSRLRRVRRERSRIRGEMRRASRARSRE